jgi:hypothetical protein
MKDNDQPEREKGPMTFDEMLELTTRSPQSASQQTPPPTAEQPVAHPTPPVEPPAIIEHPAPPTTQPPSSFDTAPITLGVPGAERFEATSYPGFSPAPAPTNLSQLLSDKPDRSWLKKGAAAVLGLFVVIALVLGIGSLFTGPIKVLIKSKPTGADVYLGEEHLGTTPLKVELPSLDEKPELRLDGYKPQSMPEFKEPDSGEAGKVYVVLKKISFPLDWTALPKGTRVWWDGKESQPKTTVAGEHKVKVKPTDQSSFIWSLTIPWNNGEVYPIGSAMAKEIERRPVLKLSLSGTTKAEVIVKDGPRFTTTVSLTKTPSSVTLPGAGKYLVKVNSTNKHSSFKKEIVLKDGSKKSVDIALWQPRSAPARTYQRGSSAPSRPRSNPRPTYTGASGGGSRIAPPSF